MGPTALFSFYQISKMTLFLHTYQISAPSLLPSTGTHYGLRANAHGVMVFAAPSRLFHRAPGLTILSRTWYHGTISSCTRTLQPSARTGKNHATAAQTATHQTAGPLAVSPRQSDLLLAQKCNLIPDEQSVRSIIKKYNA